MIRRFASRFLVLALNESKVNFLAKQYKIDPKDVEAIAEYDPSSNNAYTAWLCKVFNSHGLQYLEKLTEPLKKFTKLKNSPDFSKEKDIGKYSPEDLIKLVGTERSYRRNLSQKEIEKLIMTQGLPGAEMIWNSGGFKVWHVTKPKYARFLSSNTSWCTAQPNYSAHYCSKGGLYPVYFHDKPIAQGHLDYGGAITFLNKEDKEVSLNDPIIQQMLKVVDIPEMRMFKSKIMTAASVAKMLENPDLKGQEKEELLDSILRSKKAPVVESAIKTLAVFHKDVWINGLELLLDYPTNLGSVIFSFTSDELEVIKNSSSELAEEIVYELEEDGQLQLENADHLKVYAILSTDSEAIDKLVDRIVNNPIPINMGNMPELYSTLLNRIKSLSPEDKDSVKYIRVFLNENKGNPGAEECIFEYWKKFVKKSWKDFATILKNYPEYQEAVERYKDAITFPLVGLNVTPGADYQGTESQGASGTITSVKWVDLDATYELTVKWSDGSEESVTMLSDTFPLNNDPKNPTRVRIIPATEGEPLKPGDVVVPNAAEWRAIERVPIGTKGVVVSVKDLEDGPTAIARVDWENGASGSGFYFYRLRKVEIISGESAKEFDEKKNKSFSSLPKKLDDGTRVRRGPTWKWGNQGDNSIGTVTQERPNGWFRVEWDSGATNSYRYGIGNKDNPDTPFLLDVVPVDAEGVPGPEEMSQEEVESISKELWERYHAN